MPSFRSKKLANESMGPKPKTNQKTGIARKLAMGGPLVASASGVKGGRGANRAFGMLTGVTAGKKGIKVDPLGVAMAVSPFKLGAVAKGLRAVGKMGAASQVEARLAAKTVGNRIGAIVAGRSKLAFGAEKIIPGLQVAAEVRKASRPLFGTAERVEPLAGRILNKSRSIAASKAQSKKWLADHAVNPIENRMAVPGKTTVSGFQKMERGMYSNRAKWLGKIVNPKKGPKSK